MASLIDTSGDTPRLRLAALAATLTGTVIWGWAEGFLGFIGAAGGGVSGALVALGSWLDDVLIGGFVDTGVNAMNAGVAANAEFLMNLGLVAYPLAVIEVVVVGYLVFLTLSTIVTRARRLI